MRVSDSTLRAPWLAPGVGAMAGDVDTVDSCTLSVFLPEQIAQHRGSCFCASTLCALLSFQTLRDLVGRRMRWRIWHQLCCQPFPPTTPFR